MLNAQWQIWYMVTISQGELKSRDMPTFQKCGLNHQPSFYGQIPINQIGSQIRALKQAYSSIIQLNFKRLLKR